MQLITQAWLELEIVRSCQTWVQTSTPVTQGQVSELGIFMAPNLINMVVAIWTQMKRIEIVKMFRHDICFWRSDEVRSAIKFLCALQQRSTSSGNKEDPALKQKSLRFFKTTNIYCFWTYLKDHLPVVCFWSSDEVRSAIRFLSALQQSSISTHRKQVTRSSS